MLTYDLMESMRMTNQWLGATAQAIGAHPALALSPNPTFKMLAAWGEVTERTFSRMVAKPDWNIPSIVGADGRDHVVTTEAVVERPFGDLIRFNVADRKPMKRRVLLVAPMSGHYATLLRSTVLSLLPDADVFVTDWHNARDIPVSEGKFDIEDYTLYLVDFMRHTGPDIHVIAVCQPAPLALAATAYLAEEEPLAQPKTLTLIGGPIDPDAAATDVTDFGRRITMGQLEELAQQRVGFKYAGAGRMVYPGLLQLASFMSMNSETHGRAFSQQILNVAQGTAADHDRHNKFYDEYLAVMDMTAEFYLSTVERIFKKGEIAKNQFIVAGKQVDIGKITTVAVKTVEGADDDISAPGQCVAALDLCTGLSDDKKASHLEPGAGHYGIFAGKSWRKNIRPLVLDFIDSNSDAPVKPAAARPAAASKASASTSASAVVDTPKPAPKPRTRKPSAAKSAPASPAEQKSAEAKPATGKAAPKNTAPKKTATVKTEAAKPATAKTTGKSAPRPAPAVKSAAPKAATGTSGVATTVAEDATPKPRHPAAKSASPKAPSAETSGAKSARPDNVTQLPGTTKKTG